MNRYVFQMIGIFISLIIILNVINILRTNHKEKRISDFALSKKDFDNTTFLEKVSYVLWNIVHRLSVGLGKNKLLVKRALRYERYILIKEEKYKSPIDYIAVKFIMVILMNILYVILIIIDVLPFNILILSLFIVLGIVLPDFFWQLSYVKKCKSIASKLYESIIIIDDNLASSNIYNTINKVINELSDDIGDEYQRIAIDLSYNISLYQAFKRFYERTKIREINVIYHLLNIEQNNLEDAFHLIRKEFEYLDNLNSNKTATNIILNIMKIVYAVIPFVLIFFMYFINPSYFKDILNNSIGVVALEITVAIYAFYILAMKHILERSL